MAAGPLEQFGVERRRLSDVFRDVVGARVEELERPPATAGPPSPPASGPR